MSAIAPSRPEAFRCNVRRAELLSALVDGDRCDLRLVYRNAPMRVRIDRDTARELIRDLLVFAEGGS
jgi:hypothetical protein